MIGTTRMGLWRGLLSMAVMVAATALAALLAALVWGVGNAQAQSADGSLVSTPPPGDLVSWWPGDGNAQDIQGTNDGTLEGATFVTGKVGEAFSFDGVDDSFSADGSGTLNITGDQVTIDAWIKLENNPTTDQAFTSLIGKNNFPDGQPYQIVFESGPIGSDPSNTLPQDQWQFEYIVTNESGTREHDQSTGVIVPVDGLYHHFAMTYDGANVRLYVDGVLEYTKPFTGNLKSAPADPLVMEGDAPFSADEVDIFDRALSAEEIAAIFDADSAGKTKPCSTSGSTTDLWDVSAGTTVTTTTGILGGTDERDMFGGTFSTNPVENGNTIFSDFQPKDFVHTIEWQTANPVAAGSFNLIAYHDGATSENRSFKEFRLYGFDTSTNQFELLYTLNPTIPYGGDGESGSGRTGDILYACGDLPELSTDRFRAEFVQTVDAADASGPRIVELDGLVGGQDPPPPAPSTPNLKAASDTGSSKTDNITKDTTPTFTGTAEAGSTVEILEGTTPVGSATANSNGVYNVTTSALGEGDHSISARATNASGTTGPASGALEVKIDTKAPFPPEHPLHLLYQPSHLAQLPSGDVPGKIPVRIAWVPSQDNTGGSGLAGYLLQQSTNGDAFTDVTLLSAPSHNLTLHLVPGTDTYRFRVRATDIAGNASSFELDKAFKVKAFQESSAAVADGGSWTTATLNGAYGGSVQHASASGRKVTFNVAAGTRNVSLISTKGPNRGKVRVCVDPGTAAERCSIAIDLFSSVMKQRTVVYSHLVSPGISHKVEVRVLGQKNASSTGTRVDVDAFATTT